MAGIDRIKEYIANRELTVSAEERALLLVVMRALRPAMEAIDELMVPPHLVLYGLAAWMAREIAGDTDDRAVRAEAATVMTDLIRALIEQTDIAKHEQQEATNKMLKQIFGVAAPEKKKKVH